MPDILVALVCHKVLIKILAVDSAPFGSCPSREVNTVCNVANVVFFREVAFPQGCEHLLAYPTVQARYTVDFLRCIASEGTHTETFAVVVGIGASHADEFVPSNAQLCWITRHILAEECFVEVVVACWYRCVNGVERRRTYKFHCLIEAQTLFNIIAEALQVAKGSVAFVAMIDVFLDAEFL